MIMMFPAKTPSQDLRRSQHDRSARPVSSNNAISLQVCARNLVELRPNHTAEKKQRGSIRAKNPLPFPSRTSPHPIPFSPTTTFSSLASSSSPLPQRALQAQERTPARPPQTHLARRGR